MLETNRNAENYLHLPEKPQVLGVGPTDRFWLRYRPNTFRFTITVVPVLVVSILVPFCGWGAVPAFVLAMLTAWLPLGLIERNIRARRSLNQ